MAFDSSASGPESSTLSTHDGMANMEQRSGLGIDMNEKPLPDIPSNPQPSTSGHTSSDLRITEYPKCDTSRESLYTSPQLGFSFKPGDDVDILAQNTARDANIRNTSRLRTHQQRRSTSKKQLEASCTGIQGLEGARQRKSTTSSSKSKHLSKSCPARDIQDSESLKREDSTSSIIIAVHDNSNSGRSSIGSSRHSSQSIRQRLNRNSGSNEAITAAVRALAVGSAIASSPAPRKHESSSGTRERNSRGERSPKEGDEGPSKQNRKTGLVKSDSTVSSLENVLKQDKKPTRP
jgi:hypothetical protein